MNPLVSVVIPTKNSKKTIESCIKSVHKQSYPNIEIIIVDSKSTDNTVLILEQTDCKIIFTDMRLLSARYEGLNASSGEFVLMMDSDQLLEEDTVERSLPLFEKYDMLCLEETAWLATTIVEKMFEADKRLVNNQIGLHTNPIYGAALARFYKRDLLERAFKSIPESLFPFVIAHDHAIIYYEAWKLSNKVGVLSKAIYHIEPTNLIELWRKNFRYGKSTKKLLKEGYYNELLHKKIRFRKTSSKISKDKVLSSLLLLLKGPAYLLGLYL